MRTAIAALLLFVFATAAAQAQTRFVVPYTPGAANDTLARILAQRLSSASGQTVLVENRPAPAVTSAPSWWHAPSRTDARFWSAPTA